MVTVTAASVDTKNTRRDAQLRSADFFEIDSYPDIAFTAEAIRPSAPAIRLPGQGVTVVGTLRVRDQARPLKFDCTAAAHGDGEVWLDAAVDIHQPDFGLSGSSWGWCRRRPPSPSTPYAPGGTKNVGRRASCYRTTQVVTGPRTTRSFESDCGFLFVRFGGIFTRPPHLQHS